MTQSAETFCVAYVPLIAPYYQANAPSMVTDWLHVSGDYCPTTNDKQQMVEIFKQAQRDLPRKLIGDDVHEALCQCKVSGRATWSGVVLTGDNFWIELQNTYARSIHVKLHKYGLCVSCVIQPNDPILTSHLISAIDTGTLTEVADCVRYLARVPYSMVNTLLTARFAIHPQTHEIRMLPVGRF